LPYGCTRLARSRSFALNKSVFWVDKSLARENSWVEDDVLLLCKDGRSTVNSFFAPKDIFKAVSSWDEETRSLIVEIGLGGILDIDNIMFVNRDFSQWLLQRVDSNKGVLKIGINETVNLSEIHVSWILGIRYGGSIELTRCDGHPDVDQIEHCRSVLGIDGSTNEITVN
jgi:hypothetical protein